MCDLAKKMKDSSVKNIVQNESTDEFCQIQSADKKESTLKSTNEDVQRAIEGLKDIPDEELQEFLDDEDFMEGLDVVDAWEGDEEKSREVEFKTTHNKDQEQKRLSRERYRRDYKGSYNRERPKREEKKHEEIRRDPSKSTKDIERDKIRTKRDNESKLLAEKEKAIKHLLDSDNVVPPGTETEAIQSITERQNIDQVQMHIRRSRERRRSLERQRGSSLRRRTPDRIRLNSPRRKSPLILSPERCRSPFKMSNERHRSPLRFSPDKRRSPRFNCTRRSPFGFNPERRRSPIRRLSWERRTSTNRRWSAERHRRRITVHERRRSRSRDRQRSRSMERLRRKVSRSPISRRYSPRRRNRARSRSLERRRKRSPFINKLTRQLRSEAIMTSHMNTGYTHSSPMDGISPLLNNVYQQETEPRPSMSMPSYIDQSGLAPPMPSNITTGGAPFMNLENSSQTLNFDSVPLHSMPQTEYVSGPVMYNQPNTSSIQPTHRPALLPAPISSPQHESAASTVEHVQAYNSSHGISSTRQSPIQNFEFSNKSKDTISQNYRDCRFTDSYNGYHASQEERLKTPEPPVISDTKQFEKTSLSSLLEASVSAKGHRASKKHLNKFEQFQMCQRSIIIKPLPTSIMADKLLEFFNQYGTIKWYRFYSDHVVIEFDQRTSAEILWNKQVSINSVKLNVVRRNVCKKISSASRKESGILVKNTSSIDYQNIKHIFEEKCTFDEQLITFLNSVQLTDMEIETRYESACVQLDKIFKKIFPNCRIYRFGSTLTGLGFKECDLDIYMDVGESINESSTSDSCRKLIFNKVKHFMYRMKNDFSKIIPIPRAKVPIIKFNYIKTRISCDISFTDKLGLYKSNLIKYYASFDKRLRPLMMLIKYWARQLQISDGQKICNYALMLLIIFYLQQPFVNIIPFLSTLQSTCQPKIINGWQVNFDEYSVLLPTTNESSIPRLLYGFFFFYATFDFKSQVICPIDGISHTKSEFNEIENLPPCMNIYKATVKENEELEINISKPMCVQDPIQLNNNVTKNTSVNTLNSFVKYCTISAGICARTSKDNYKGLLNNLFAINVKSKCKHVTISANELQYVNKSNNMKICADSMEKIEFLKNDWYVTVFDIVKDIFEKVYCLQVKVLTTEIGAEEQNVEILSNLDIEKQHKIILHCIGSHCTWGKKKIKLTVDPSLSILQKEILRSKQIIENYTKDKANEINLEFTCVFQKIYPVGVSLTLYNNNNNNNDDVFYQFVCVTTCKLPALIRQTLMHIQQCGKY